MRCNPEQVSAYADGALGRAQARLLEAHLAHCVPCAARLTEYRRFGRGLRSLPALVAPADLTLGMRSAIAEPPPPNPRALPALVALAAAALFAAIAFPLVHLWGGTGPVERPAVVASAGVAAAPSGVPNDAVLEVRFEGPVNRQVVERSVQISPAVPTRILWRGDVMLIVPERADAAEAYAVAIDRAYTASGEPFRASIPATHAQPAAEPAARPPAAPAEPTATAALATATPDLGAYNALATQVTAALALLQATQTAVAATPTPMPAPAGPAASAPSWTVDPGPASAAAPPPNPTPASPGLQPPPDGTRQAIRAAVATALAGCLAPVGQSFAGLLRAEAALVERLGCATGAEHSSAMTSQSFERGGLLLRHEPKIIYTLLTASRLWTAQPDGWRDGETLNPVGTPPAGFQAPAGALGKVWRDVRTGPALGWATAPEVRFSGRAQDFQRGTLLLDATGRAYVLFADGLYLTFELRPSGPTATATVTIVSAGATPK
jgi:hypothetical protein